MRRHLPHLQPEGDVVEHRQVRIERIALKHHRDVPVTGRHVVDDAAADRDRPLADLLEARDHPQGGRLAAAGRSDDDDELTVADLEGVTSVDRRFTDALASK